MPNWIKYNEEDIQSGDIVETVTKIPEHSPIFKGVKVRFIKHYGIVVLIDGKQNLIHNVIGRCPTITPLDEIFTNRRIHRVFRTGMSDEEILKKYSECKSKKYRLWKWNCEDLMTHICGMPIGYPQRDGWLIGIFVVGLAILVAILVRKK